MSKLALVLSQLLEKFDITPTELARRTKIGQPVIHRLASGETDNPKLATLGPIANHFRISIGQLVGDEPLPQNLDIHVYKQAVLNTLPLLEWEDLLDESALKKKSLKQQEIYTEITLSKQAFALKVLDTTMRPRFPENTLLLVEPALQPNDRQYVIYHLVQQNQIVFREFLTDGKNHYLKPINSDFEKIQISSADRCLGVVVQVRSDLV